MTKNFDDVKKLGFGLMRLPQKEGVIDVERVKTMVDMFLDAGFNYFDTAFAYAGSEDAIRQALVNRVPRKKFFSCHQKCRMAQLQDQRRRGGSV